MLTVSAVVALLTELVKWAYEIPGRKAPVVVVALSAVGVVLWGWSQPETVTRVQTWSYFSGWVLVMMASAGVFDFVRKGAAQVTNLGKP